MPYLLETVERSLNIDVDESVMTDSPTKPRLTGDPSERLPEGHIQESLPMREPTENALNGDLEDPPNTSEFDKPRLTGNPLDSLSTVRSLETSQGGDPEEPRSSVGQLERALVTGGVDEPCMRMDGGRVEPCPTGDKSKPLPTSIFSDHFMPRPPLLLNKKLLILDLNGFMCHSVKIAESYRWKTTSLDGVHCGRNHIYFERPGLHQFLASCFAHLMWQCGLVVLISV